MTGICKSFSKVTAPPAPLLVSLEIIIHKKMILPRFHPCTFRSPPAQIPYCVALGDCPAFHIHRTHAFLCFYLSIQYPACHALGQRVPASVILPRMLPSPVRSGWPERRVVDHIIVIQTLIGFVPDVLARASNLHNGMVKSVPSLMRSVVALSAVVLRAVGIPHPAPCRGSQIKVLGPRRASHR